MSVSADLPGARPATLSEFLRARLDEDQAAARAAIVRGSGVWRRSQHEYDAARVEGDDMVIYDEGGHTAEHAAHIARHDPARVLAEVEAKRRIVEQCDDELRSSPWSGAVGKDLADKTLRLLASVYSGHPDYRAEDWAP